MMKTGPLGNPCPHEVQTSPAATTAAIDLNTVL
jgi:hypothetical protein